MKSILVTSGEPAGIGPDLCLLMAQYALPIVVLGDRQVLAERASLLGLDVVFEEYQHGKDVVGMPNHLTIWSTPCEVPVKPGVLDSRNAAYVVRLLTWGIQACLQGQFSALVTAPVHKAVINQAGIPFTGHTEFFAEYCQCDTVVMMLACEAMKVALVTTHLPLHRVSEAITGVLIRQIITCLHRGLVQDFGIQSPVIHVAGLNPHAGESGCLGEEEIQVITPALADLVEEGIRVKGPFSADTLFSSQSTKQCDAFVAMYHDQGLPVLKYAGFGQAVNVTLGLPVIRTSVDHGTALELAGCGQAEPGSLLAAICMAGQMAEHRGLKNG